MHHHFLEEKEGLELYIPTCSQSQSMGCVDSGVLNDCCNRADESNQVKESSEEHLCEKVSH